MCSQVPSDYQHTTYTVTDDIEELYKQSVPTSTKLTTDSILEFFRVLDSNFLIYHTVNVTQLLPKYTKAWFTQQLRLWVRKHPTGDFPNKRTLLSIYHTLVRESYPLRNNWLPLLTLKDKKSQSGVVVVTVVTSPTPTVNGRQQNFTCEWNCYYCPNEPGQPRSYLHDEPSVLRANMNGFDAVLQFTDRLLSLVYNGHPADKIELLVLGGTWSSYPLEYRETFVRDLFYAANTFRLNTHDTQPRERLSLEDEHRLNETARCKIIGLTLETRPDCITPEEVVHFRRVGATRIQLGIQHTDSEVLRIINRECSPAQAKQGILRLKQCGFKVDIHLMTQLPGTDVNLDRSMFKEVLGDPEWQADQWKIYPCETTPWTIIEKWQREGKYKPYPNEQMTELLLEVKPVVHPWIRLNRVVRDIPAQYIMDGNQTPHLRQELHRQLAKRGQWCGCMRCREIGGKQAGVDYQPDDISLLVRPYQASGGMEYFISYEVKPTNSIVGGGGPDRFLLGFLRLRIETNPDCWAYQSFPKLRGVAMIRELHVYGQVIPVGGKKTHQPNTKATQHTGLGRKLVAEAEKIAREHKCRRIAVISGVGVREFYRRYGYQLQPNEPSQLLYKKLPTTGDVMFVPRRLLGLLLIFIAIGIIYWCG